MSKQCSKCKKTLPITDFYKRSAGSLHSACKECERAMAKAWYKKNPQYAKQKAKEWRKSNPDKVRQYRAENRRKHYLEEVKRKYNLDSETFWSIYDEQGGRCAICNKQLAWSGGKDAPHVDHCHETGRVRGVLCRKCNSGLGYFNDDLKLLKSATKYLQWHGYSAKD